MSYLVVAIDAPLRQTFDYLPCNGYSAIDYPSGMRVEVPFGNRRLMGIVIGHTETSSIDTDAIKAAFEPQDETPLLGKPLLAFMQWVSSYYHYPLGKTIFTLLPSYFSKNANAQPYLEKATRISIKGKGLPVDALNRAPKQQALLNRLRDSERAMTLAELKAAGFSSAQVKTLTEKSLLEPTTVSLTPKRCKSLHQGTSSTEPLALNEEQSQALRACLPANSGEFRVTLVDGVTGSGKTEIYLQAANKILAQSLQVLVLVPEISLTPQTLRRFTERFDTLIAVMHSGLNDKERAAAWHAMRSGEASILLGTRSAIAAPMCKPGLIIVDEEHDLSYKQQDSLRYSARDLAISRAQQLQIPVILGSATPSLESRHNASSGKYQIARLDNRHRGASEAELKLVDARKKALTAGFTDEAITALQETLSRHKQALVFINRRGFAPQILCHDCGWSCRCESCDASMTYHKAAHELRCHHCDARAAMPINCPSCRSTNLRAVGEGTQRCAEALDTLFGPDRVLRVDRDSVSTAAALAEALHKVEQGEPCILVGTQMLAKGHHFSALETVVMLNVDQGLYGADFRDIERTLQLLTQVAGRAGRESNTGQVLVQTHMPDHPVLLAWKTQSYFDASALLLEERKLRQLPPYAYLATISADSPSPQTAMTFLKGVAQILGKASQQQSHEENGALVVKIIGPYAAMMERLAGRHRATLLIKTERRTELHKLLAACLPEIEQLPKKHALRWQLDIDPQIMP